MVIEDGFLSNENIRELQVAVNALLAAGGSVDPSTLARGGYHSGGGGAIAQEFAGAYEHFTDYAVDYDPAGNMPCDISDPDNPAVLVDGIYAVSLEVGVNTTGLDIVDGASCYTELNLACNDVAPAGGPVNLALDVPLFQGSQGPINVPIAGTIYMTEGQMFAVFFAHNNPTPIDATVRHFYVQRVA